MDTCLVTAPTATAFRDAEELNAVMHYHRPRNSVGVITAQSFNLSVAGDAIYLNVGEQTSNVWTGLLKPKSRFSLLTSRP